ncbi:6,7-dimethyl-8-ribityllumazine synthase [Rhodobium orientis]|uniref:6,7-dimethyl-8-ribityllumazine synthase n=1 Tax=Rhodobium orientis TaxID=34017 RepID=A0A327JM95_9HYPH|nr:6,7-dimethyl-8-ribityllumazine synthase [Rhodobium orientis]MBB4304815.1 6,7-dimethyl-8-ribityllumazine synthase [Rhodobium orientis]MBK5948011.1 6,7-dimethyl-8-ribityllumazine synthase [Rhodobium orientis]RAI27447.1 6,7-dimethyl-8-ribityllumazine synthase [Rhodobium orientis]
MRKDTPHILIIDARFYEDISDELVKGATEALEAAGSTYERISVPGVLEIPPALSIAMEAMDEGTIDFDGVVVLGCVIRGETSHYDIAAGESARGVMQIAIDEGLAVGNGILTVETREQAWVRAGTIDRNKGAVAVNAALALCKLRKDLEL